MSETADQPIMTLEPLIEAIRDAVEGAGWELSGLQKTTSHQFEGRWEGESTRSAYLFFHRPDGPDFVSVDVYLDETSRGLTGNAALVADLVRLEALGDPRDVMTALAGAWAGATDARERRPLTLRFRLADAGRAVDEAETEVRFKVQLPRRVLSAGRDGVTGWVGEAIRAFSEVLRTPEVIVLAEDDVEPA